MIRISVPIVSMLVLCLGSIGAGGAFAQGQYAKGLLQVCLAAGLPADASADRWVSELEKGASEASHAIVYRAQGRLITSDEKLVIEEEALANDCDLVVETDAALARAYYLLESAPDGPMRDTRATVDLVARNAIALSGMMFTRGDVVSDPELLDLMRQEIDELAASQGVNIGSLPHYVCGPVCEPIAAP